MATTTMGVKLDDAARERIKAAASQINRTPHWLIKQAIFSYLDRLDQGETLPELPLSCVDPLPLEIAGTPPQEGHTPFLAFAEQILPQSVLRANITAAYRRAESDAVPMLLEQARLPSSWPSRRINWPTVWQGSCAARRTPADGPEWSRVCCRSSPSPPRRASH